MSRVINVYGMGGTGVKAASRLLPHLNVVEGSPVPVMNVFAVDASTADIPRSFPSDRQYIIPELKGSGQLRAENYEVFTQHIRSIVSNFPVSEDGNFVIFSASGGSGSVLGPLLVQYMMENNIPVIAFVVGDGTSSIYGRNTARTLLSLSNMVDNVEKSLVLNFFENSSNTPIEVVNNRMQLAVVLTAMLMSGNILGLDEKDIEHWLSPEVYGFEDFSPMIMEMKINDVTTINNKEHLISCLGVTDNIDGCHPGRPTMHFKAGQIPPEFVNNPNGLKVEMPIFFSTYAGVVADTITRMENAVDEIQRAVTTSVLKKPTGKTSVKGASSKGNMVL